MIVVMAAMDDAQRRKTRDASNAQRSPNLPQSKSSRSQTSPNCQRHPDGEASSWSTSSSPNHHNKKSVLMRVKEKARKLKKSLSVRRRREENDSRSPYATPPGGVGPLDDEKEETEYFGTPLYESEVAPGTDKQAAKDHPQEASTGSSEKHKMTSDVEQRKEERPSTTMGVQSMNGAPSSGSTDTIPKNNAEPNADSLPESIESKLSGLTISTATHDANKPESSSEGKENARSSLQSQDKGVSVKEYLMQKLEPGEDERALSQVITQTISPRRERMKEAMSSFLRNEEPSQSTSKTSNSELDISPAASDSNQNSGARDSTESSPNLKSSSLAASPNLKSSSLAASPNPRHSLESNLSNASNRSQTSPPASCQNQNVGSNSPTYSNLKPNQSSSNPSPSSSPSLHANTSPNATRSPASTSSHEGTKDENR